MRCTNTMNFTSISKLLQTLVNNINIYLKWWTLVYSGAIIQTWRIPILMRLLHNSWPCLVLPGLKHELQHYSWPAVPYESVPVPPAAGVISLAPAPVHVRSLVPAAAVPSTAAGPLAPAAVTYPDSMKIENAHMPYRYSHYNAIHAYNFNKHFNCSVSKSKHKPINTNKKITNVQIKNALSIFNITCIRVNCSAKVFLWASKEATCLWYCNRCCSHSAERWRNSCKNAFRTYKTWSAGVRQYFI